MRSNAALRVLTEQDMAVVFSRNSDTDLTENETPDSSTKHGAKHS